MVNYNDYGLRHLQTSLAFNIKVDKLVCGVLYNADYFSVVHD